MIGSDDAKPMNGDSPERFFSVSDDALHRIIVSLTVVHGYTQLLRRRAQHNPAGGSEQLDEALVHMDEAARKMAAELWTVMLETPGPRMDTDQD